MSFAFNAAPFSQTSSNETNYIQQKREARNKTIKRRETTSNVDALIQKLHNSDNNEDIADFNPISPPHSESVSKTIERQNNPQRQEVQTYNNPNLDNDKKTPPVTGINSLLNGGSSSLYESFEQKGINSAAADYYKQYIPTFYNKMSENTGGNKELLDKLNYMIHLLEEQQEEKTGHVTEEIILYSFLGVFLIFIVDSFARAGKYMR